MAKPVVIHVAGVPQTKGSIRAVPIKGRAYPMLTSTNRRLPSWEKAIGIAARIACVGRDDLPWDCPVVLSAMFYLPAPKSLRKRGPVFPTKRNDLDKLVRGCCDPLSGVVYVDDSRIVTLVAHKLYAGRDEDEGGEPRAVIAVRPLLGNDLPTIRRMLVIGEDELTRGSDA